MNDKGDDLRRWLKGLPGWGEAHVERLPGDGDAWRLSVDNRSAVLKRDSQKRPALLGSRQHEAAAQARAAALGLAAEVLWQSPEGLLAEWLVGDVPTPARLREPAFLDRLADTLKRVHKLPAVGRSFDSGAWARYYRQTLADQGRLDDELLAVCNEVALATLPGPQVPAHNDLVAGNLIDDGTVVRLIDWEWAADNSAFFDLATVIVEAKLSGDARTALLGAYFGNAAVDEAGIDSAVALYEALRTLWQASRLPVIP